MMASTQSARLTFLYPSLLRATSSTATAAARISRHGPQTSVSRPRRHQPFGTVAARQQDLHPQQRYGTANEPPPHLNSTTKSPASKDGEKGDVEAPTTSDAATTKPETKEAEADQQSEKQQQQQPERKHRSLAQEVQQQQEDKKRAKRAAKLAQQQREEQQELEKQKSKETVSAASTVADPETPIPMPPPPIEEPQPGGPLQVVLEKPAPSHTAYHQSDETKESTSSEDKTGTSTSSSRRRPPHLEAPRYVHHFDTYTLVRNLSSQGGFSEGQSVTAMKAVRALLADNMDLAREGLVSRSDLENEQYLFRAACSELRTEIQTKRRAAVEKMRGQRQQLQHESDILGQRITQETASLKDELKGMFDDRRMAVRMEQRTMDSKIQELNYAITVKLNSDGRSDVEGLRWILTRRSVAALGFIAATIISAGYYLGHKYMQEEAAAAAAKASSSSSGNVPTAHEVGFGHPSDGHVGHRGGHGSGGGGAGGEGTGSGGEAGLVSLG